MTFTIFLAEAINYLLCLKVSYQVNADMLWCSFLHFTIIMVTYCKVASATLVSGRHMDQTLVSASNELINLYSHTLSVPISAEMLGSWFPVSLKNNHLFYSLKGLLHIDHNSGHVKRSLLCKFVVILLFLFFSHLFLVIEKGASQCVLKLNSQH